MCCRSLISAVDACLCFLYYPGSHHLMTDCLLLILITFHHDLFSSRTLAASYLIAPLPSPSLLPLPPPAMVSHPRPSLTSHFWALVCSNIVACGRFPLEAVVLFAPSATPVIIANTLVCTVPPALSILGSYAYVPEFRMRVHCALSRQLLRKNSGLTTRPRK